MQKAFAANRQAFVDAIALDTDKERLAEATAYLEKNEERYKAIEARMDALSERCAAEPTVVAAFRAMEAPQ